MGPIRFNAKEGSEAHSQETAPGVTLPFTLDQLRQALPHLNITTHLATGGQKHVFRCTCGGSEAALKLILKTPHSEARAEREVEAMKLADSPHLVRILSEQVEDVEVAGQEYVYFVEEYVEGNDLSDLINMDWSYDAVIRLARNLSAAVRELWKHRIVHRDIKPSNIRVRLNGEAVLLDVGLGRHINRTTLTPPFGLPGTPGYYSPEQIKLYRRRLDFRSDLFLIGLCMYEVTCKVNPLLYETRDDQEYVKRLLTGDITPIDEIDPQVPGTLAQLVMRLLQPYAHLRPRSFEVLDDMFQKAEEELHVLSDPARVGQGERSER